MPTKITVTLPDDVVRRLGVDPEESLGLRILDAVDRYSEILATARQETLGLLTELELYQVRVACQAWLTGRAPAKSMVAAVVAEIASASRQDGVIAGVNVVALLAKMPAV